MEDNVHTMTIKIVTDEDIVRGLMSNTLSIITSMMVGEFIGLKIANKCSSKMSSFTSGSNAPVEN